MCAAHAGERTSVHAPRTSHAIAFLWRIASSFSAASFETKFSPVRTARAARRPAPQSRPCCKTTGAPRSRRHKTARSHRLHRIASLGIADARDHSRGPSGRFRPAGNIRQYRPHGPCDPSTIWRHGSGPPSGQCSFAPTLGMTAASRRNPFSPSIPAISTSSAPRVCSSFTTRGVLPGPWILCVLASRSCPAAHEMPSRSDFDMLLDNSGPVHDPPFWDPASGLTDTTSPDSKSARCYRC
jgi:hypothetical protein